MGQQSSSGALSSHGIAARVARVEEGSATMGAGASAGGEAMVGEAMAGEAGGGEGGEAMGGGEAGGEAGGGADGEGARGRGCGGTFLSLVGGAAPLTVVVGAAGSVDGRSATHVSGRAPPTRTSLSRHRRSKSIQGPRHLLERTYLTICRL